MGDSMKSRTLESGVFLRYREGEPGFPALFCVHGLGASGASYLEAFDSIAGPSLEYLVRHDLPHLAFPDAGHSPMIDEPARFYSAVAGFIAGCTA